MFFLSYHKFRGFLPKWDCCRLPPKLLWDVKSAKSVAAFPSNIAVFSPDGRMLATTGEGEDVTSVILRDECCPVTSPRDKESGAHFAITRCDPLSARHRIGPRTVASLAFPWDTCGMNTESQQLLESALALPDSDRAEIAASLIQSLDAESDDDVDAAWALEIQRRIQSIDNGEVKLVPWDDVMREMRDRRHG